MRIYPLLVSDLSWKGSVCRCPFVAGLSFLGNLAAAALKRRSLTTSIPSSQEWKEVGAAHHQADCGFLEGFQRSDCAHLYSSHRYSSCSHWIGMVEE